METLKIGTMEKGPRNAISDVAGVTVGHCTVEDERNLTGVTVVMPCQDDIFRRKMIAACHVLNGYGKTTGLVQIEELGTLETPVVLTNTLNVGLVYDAIVEHMLREGDRRGYPITSVNPVVCECNDASLNDIRNRPVGQAEVFAAIAAASVDFEQGAAGAGRGMTCHGLKGGVGSSSRRMEIAGETFTLGVLALTNHGRLADLTIGGRNIGAEIAGAIGENRPDRGSCIMVVATDLPVTSRQLGRIIRRCSVGLARLGSYIGHGSGEVMIGFSTANRISDDEEIRSIRCVRDASLDPAFRAAAEATEEAVLQSMLAARRTVGYSGQIRHALREFWSP